MDHFDLYGSSSVNLILTEACLSSSGSGRKIACTVENNREISVTPVGRPARATLVADKISRRREGGNFCGHRD